ncbi:MAG TPA: hypothetical protein VNI81_15935 [Candidatus Limnocylindrales bacterium]|nr:hypothetical protein [Candidatus Limnocylindrales bacterium]
MRRSLLLVALLGLALAGCKAKPKMDYTGLDQSGMWSTNLAQVKKMNVSPAEVNELTRLKQAGASDDMCLSLLKAARGHNHEFTSSDSVISLSSAGYSDAQILEMAQADKLDVLSSDAVMLKLIGLSNSTVQIVIQRREQGLPTLTSAQIGRLKNIGESEKKILEVIYQGLSEQQAEAYVARLESARNHSHTEFVRNRGRKPR